MDEGAFKPFLFPIFQCLQNSIVFLGNFTIFCAHEWRKMLCCKLVLDVDKKIILNLAMMTIMMHFHLNTAILFLLLG